MTSDQKNQWLLSQVAKHQDDVIRYVRSILRNNEAAEDIVQEAFLKLWKEDPKRIGDKARPWLFYVCRNLAIDKLRQGKKLTSDNLDDLVDTQQVAADDQMELDEKSSWLNAAMLKLTPQQREVVQLKFQADLSYKDIAAITKLTVSHVGVVIHQSLKILNEAKDKNFDRNENSKRKTL